MKKTPLLICMIFLLSVVGASASHTSAEKMKSSIYTPKSMSSGYALGSWIQFTDDKISLVTRQNQGYGHRSSIFNAKRDALVSDFLCATWKHNGQCTYEIDSLGRTHFVAVKNKWRNDVII